LNRAETSSHTGRVTAFDERRGLGEIEDADGARYAFHCTQIADGSRTIPVDAPVAFLVAPGLLGRWQATHIEPVPTRA
jgi:cold shock CspA family protein